MPNTFCVGSLHMAHIHNTDTQVDKEVIRDRNIEKFIHTNHKEWGKYVVDIARRCTAITAERAESEYRLCISRINERYNKLLATVDFKLQVAYKIASAKRTIEDLYQQERNQIQKAWSEEWKKQSRSNQSHRVSPLIGLCFLISTIVTIGLFGTMRFSMLHLIILAITGLLGIPIVRKVIEGAEHKILSPYEAALESHTRQIQHQKVSEAVNRKRKLIGYAVSLERLIENMYHESIRAFQTEYVFHHANVVIPKGFAVEPPQLRYIYRPLLVKWGE